mgnify:CR=1 FL=1
MSRGVRRAVLGLGSNLGDRLALLQGAVDALSAAAEIFKPEIEHLIGTTRPGLASLSVLGAVLIATSGTNALIKALNRAHGVDETRPFVPRYLLAVGVTLVAGSAMRSG